MERKWVNKKDLEKYYLDEVIKLGGIRSEGKIIHSESPDFLITNSEGITGVEITRFFHSSPKKKYSLQQKEALWQKIINETYRIFFNTHTEPVFVLFSWNDKFEVESSQIYSQAKKIVKIVETNIPKKLKENIHLNSEYLWQKGMSNCLHGMDILLYKPCSSWGFIEAGPIGVSTKDLQEFINSKNIKVADYRNKAKRVILLIVAEGQHISSSISLSEDVLTSSFESDFDNIILYARVEKRIFSINIDRIEK